MNAAQTGPEYVSDESAAQAYSFEALLRTAGAEPVLCESCRDGSAAPETAAPPVAVRVPLAELIAYCRGAAGNVLSSQGHGGRLLVGRLAAPAGAAADGGAEGLESAPELTLCPAGATGAWVCSDGDGPKAATAASRVSCAAGRAHLLLLPPAVRPGGAAAARLSAAWAASCREGAAAGGRPAAAAAAATLRPGDAVRAPPGWCVAWRAAEGGCVLLRRTLPPGAAGEGGAAAAAAAPAAPGLLFRSASEAAAAADVHRRRGNAAFSLARYAEAAEAYGRAVGALDGWAGAAAAGGGADGAEADDDNDAQRSRAALLATCLANKAAAALRRRRWEEALQDCNRVLRAGRMDDPVALKALFRRGKAREGLGDADGALADFKAVAELQPANGEAADEVERYASVLHRIVVMSHGDADMRRRQTGGLFAAPA